MKRVAQRQLLIQSYVPHEPQVFDLPERHEVRAVLSFEDPESLNRGGELCSTAGVFYPSGTVLTSFYSALEILTRFHPTLVPGRGSIRNPGYLDVCMLIVEMSWIRICRLMDTPVSGLGWGTQQAVLSCIARSCLRVVGRASDGQDIRLDRGNSHELGVQDPARATE